MNNTETTLNSVRQVNIVPKPSTQTRQQIVLTAKNDLIRSPVLMATVASQTTHEGIKKAIE